MRTALIVASLVGALAIVLKLTAGLQRAWLERELRVGDLRALSNTAFRRGDRPASTQIERTLQTSRRGTRTLLGGLTAHRCCRAPADRFLLCFVAALIFHLATVEGHCRIVVAG